MIGTVVGAFEIKAKLGEGPLGESYRAAHKQSGSDVVVKLVRRELSVLPAANGVIAEADAIARIAFSNIAKVYEGGRHDGRVYVVSEHLAGGETLAARMAKGRMSSTQLAGICHQLANALITAQRSNIAHLDLKPQNVFLLPDPERPSKERVIVTDFGFGKLVLASPETCGPAAYLAPEAWRGQGDASADIYALGCLSFEMACGRTPFSGDAAAQRTKHLTEDPASVRSMAPDMAIALDKLIARMLEKVPAERPRSLREIAKLFDMFAGRSAPLDETAQD
jgi:eukaryotic-like serine/threonine-protein kinase